MQLRTYNDYQTDDIKEGEQDESRQVANISHIVSISYYVLQEIGNRVARPDIAWQLLAHILPKDKQAEIEEDHHAASQTDTTYDIVDQIKIFVLNDELECS